MLYLWPLFIVEIDPLSEISICRKQQDRIELLPDLKRTPSSNSQETERRKNDENLKISTNSNSIKEEDERRFFCLHNPFWEFECSDPNWCKYSMNISTKSFQINVNVTIYYMHDVSSSTTKMRTIARYAKLFIHLDIKV